jgi:hypothetical protein
VWLRALATDEELKTVFDVFDTEEEFTGFMAVFANDEDAAMKEAERAGATKSQAGELHAIATRLFDLFKRLASVLGYKAWKDPARVAAMEDLYVIAHRLIHGDAFMAPQQRNRYVEDELSVGLTKDGGGRVVRRGVVPSGRPVHNASDPSVQERQDDMKQKISDFVDEQEKPQLTDEEREERSYVPPGVPTGRITPTGAGPLEPGRAPDVEGKRAARDAENIAARSTFQLVLDQLEALGIDPWGEFGFPLNVILHSEMLNRLSSIDGVDYDPKTIHMRDAAKSRQLLARELGIEAGASIQDFIRAVADREGVSARDADTVLSWEPKSANDFITAAQEAEPGMYEAFEREWFNNAYRAEREALQEQKREAASRTPESVEFADNERRNENANAELLAQIPDEPRVKEQDGHTRPGGSESDNVNIILGKKWDRAKKNLNRWIKQNMKRDRGTDPEFRKLMLQAQRLADKGKWRGLAAHNRMKRIVKDLKEQYGKDRVNQSLAMVLDGRMSLGQFKRIFNLLDESAAIESLQEVLDYQDEVQDMLFKNDSIPQELRKRILANARYQTRFYAIHVLGSGWVTPDEHYISAVDAIVEEFDGAIQRSLDKATAAAGKKIQFDFGEYIYATHQRKKEMTADLSDTRAVMIERAARDLYRWIDADKGIQRIRLEGGKVQADWTADSIRTLAEQTVDGYLDNAVLKGKKAPGPIGGMPISNMMHRKLDKVFRDLYGEIQDPGSRLARTMEVQSTLLATATMFQKMFEQGEGKWWSEGRQGDFAKRLSENEHGGDLTPGDRRKYGSMAGKWVTQEAYDLIHQSGTFTREMDTGIKAYAQWVQGVTRGTRLLWWKTAARNFLTSITGFAFGSGDALEKGWGKHLKDGTVLATRITDALLFKRDPEALEILADLVEKDIFDVRQETQLAEVQANLDRLTAQGIKGKALKPLKIAMQTYGLIDLPAKYAAYHVRIDKGDTHAQAVEHLHKFYQYRDSVPEFVTKLNRFGFGDYFGYTYDSTRIFFNQLSHMVTEAGKGNIKPLFGMTMRLTIPAFRFRVGAGTLFKVLAPTTTAKIAASGMANVLTLLGLKEDDEDDELFRVATDDEIRWLRHSLPSYDRDQPLAVWFERESPDDPWTIKWQVLGNLSAFPFEDIILGAWQSASQDPDRNFGQTLLNNVTNASPLSIGMMPENVWKLISGNESIIAPQFKEPGLLDVVSDYARARRTGTPIRSDYDDIIGNRLFDFFGDSFVPGQTFRMLDKLLEIKYGKDPMLGRALDTPELSDVSDIMFRLIRKYDRDKPTQEKVLRQMIAGELEGYENEKWLAGAAGREELRTQQGPNKGELLDSERARENWHTMLKSIEGKVSGFRVLTKGNFNDVEINAILKNTPLRSGEREHIINGTVNEMKAKEFEFDHKPRATQRGDELVIEYFNDNKTVNYKDIHTMLEESGYIPGKYGPGFRRRDTLPQ